MIDVNCASIPGDLFDQELFGPEESALTSAILRSNGLITDIAQVINSL